MSLSWLVPMMTAGAGLAGGLLTWKFAPTTAGIGTNAAIRAFHNNEKVVFRTSIFKLITSALTIGGGRASGAGRRAVVEWGGSTARHFPVVAKRCRGTTNT